MRHLLQQEMTPNVQETMRKYTVAPRILVRPNKNSIRSHVRVQRIRSCNPLLMSNAAALRCKRLNILRQPVLSKGCCLSDRRRAKENAALRRFRSQSRRDCILYLLHTPWPQWHIPEPGSPAFLSFPGHKNRLHQGFCFNKKNIEDSLLFVFIRWTSPSTCKLLWAQIRSFKYPLCVPVVIHFKQLKKHLSFQWARQTWSNWE